MLCKLELLIIIEAQDYYTVGFYFEISLKLYNVKFKERVIMHDIKSWKSSTLSNNYNDTEQLDSRVAH